MALQLSAFDVVALVVIVLGAIAGLSRGFVAEVLSLFAWVAGFAAVHYLYAPGKVIATRFTGGEAAGAALAFLVIFLVAFMIVQALAAAAGRTTRNSALGPADRLLGFGFGALKGLLAVAVVYLLGNMVADVISPGWRPEWLKPVRTAPLVGGMAKTMTDFVEQRRERAHVAHPKP